MRLDLLLIHPNGRAGIYQGLSDLAAVEPPLWCAMLAAYVRGRGHSVEIIDAEAENLDPQVVAGLVSSRMPRLACVVAYGHQPSASTQVMPAAGATVRAIEDRLGSRVATMLLGGHVAALPERTMAEESVKFVCTGEGFVTLDETLRALKVGGGINLYDVRGLIIRPKDTQSAAAPLFDNLDAIEPAYDLLPMHVYRAHNWHCLGGLDRAGYASIYTTLGCPYSCSFCCIQAPFRRAGNNSLATISDGRVRTDLGEPNSYRRWSPKRVGETLENLARRGIRNVKIADEMFVLNRTHVEGVCEEIIRRKLDLNLWAYARTDTVRDGMPEKLKAAGFNWLAFGIESGSAAVRDGSNKELDADQIRATLEKVRTAGIHVIGNYIFGLPGETRETMQDTLDLATDLNTEWGNFYCAMAYPGSPLYAQTLASLPEHLPTSWAGYSQHGRETLPLRTETLSAKEIVTFRDAAHRIYHSSERYLSMIEQKFGEVGVLEVKRMLAAKLDRGAA